MLDFTRIQLPTIVSLQPITPVATSPVTPIDILSGLNVRGDWAVGIPANYTVVPLPDSTTDFLLKTDAGYCYTPASGATNFTCAPAAIIGSPTVFQLVRSSALTLITLFSLDADIPEGTGANNYCKRLTSSGRECGLEF